MAVPRLYVRIFGNRKKAIVYSCLNPGPAQQVEEPAREGRIRRSEVHGLQQRDRDLAAALVATLLGTTRATRIAPVSREMILNYVAQHVLDQPRSY